MDILAHLEPKAVFRFFEELCRIPHESGHTRAASDWVVRFAQERSLRCRQEDSGNVTVWKDAAPGYEDHPAVLLQGHLDMVCVKAPGVEHDFSRDPLDLCVEDGWVKARGTTLGGDDGIAVAMMMALLDSGSVPHPPLEAVFTVDEEIGLLGAASLDCSQLQGRLLINLDSEAEGVLTVGCAGGARCDLVLPLPEAAAGKARSLSLSGLPGGHSGAAIHKNIANANRLLAKCLAGVPGLRLISLHGGEQDNAIPDRAEAQFVLPEDQAEAVSAEINRIFQRELAAHSEAPNAACSLSPAANAPALSEADSRKVLDLILSAPNGVQAMEPDLPGQVRTSLNLGILRLEGGELRLTWSVRSSVGAEKEALVQKLKALTDASGASFSRRGDYPAWEYRKESLLRDTMVRVFEAQYGRAPVVETIHAGLECGLLAEKLPGLDAVSVGPDLMDIHSPRERMSVASVQRTWKYLLAVLAEL